jgi:hypothetical protein
MSTTDEAIMSMWPSQVVQREERLEGMMRRIKIRLEASAVSDFDE